MTIREAKIYIRNELKSIYPKNEIDSFIRILFEDLSGIQSYQLISEPLSELTTGQFEALKDACCRLKREEPVQHILGYTYFYDYKIAVSPDVLIPRPETEEMVDLIVHGHREKEPISILDIGTGSGCIAVALAGHLSRSTVFALDISEKALEIAQRNALENGVHICFIQGDVFTEISELQPSNFDLIVSNPPYVCTSEKEKMAKNVLDYDPALALFVKDEAPLIFYERIVRYSFLLLKPGGSLYVEINERFGKEVCDLFERAGYIGVSLYKDIQTKDRIVSGMKRL